MATICVYASSSEAIAPPYFAAAQALGQLIGQRGHTLIYGGGALGLMGAVARSTHAGGGRVIGVIPEKLTPQGYNDADEMIVTQTMRERKQVMEDRADAFVVLPGGFGTLEEMLEILTLKQLGYHYKAVTVLNTEGYYDPLLAAFEHIFTEGFAMELLRQSYHIASRPEELLTYIESYQPPTLPDKLDLVLAAAQQAAARRRQDGQAAE